MFESAILKSEYLPPISTIWGAMNAKKVWIEVNENYQKKSTRNRANILGVNGIEILSVPLRKGKNNKMPIDEVTISYEDKWQSKHLHSIKSAYGNSPYFEYYFDPLAAILKKQHDSLLTLNRKVLEFMVEAINIEIDLLPTAKYESKYGEHDLDLRNIKFNNPDIANYKPKSYNQVFEEKHGFVSRLSLLDLLMCKGPESILYI